MVSKQVYFSSFSPWVPEENDASTSSTYWPELGENFTVNGIALDVDVYRFTLGAPRDVSISLNYNFSAGGLSFALYHLNHMIVKYSILFQNGSRLTANLLPGDYYIFIKPSGTKGITYNLTRGLNLWPSGNSSVGTPRGLRATVDFGFFVSNGAILAYRILWGDGRGSSELPGKIIHEYAEPGIYNVTLSIIMGKVGHSPDGPIKGARIQCERQVPAMGGFCAIDCSTRAETRAETS
ncbi:MAG: PKD domain-containing protein [Promethearchaeota archaeon]